MVDRQGEVIGVCARETRAILTGLMICRFQSRWQGYMVSCHGLTTDNQLLVGIFASSCMGQTSEQNTKDHTWQPIPQIPETSSSAWNPLYDSMMQKSITPAMEHWKGTLDTLLIFVSIQCSAHPTMVRITHHTTDRAFLRHRNRILCAILERPIPRRRI